MAQILPLTPILAAARKVMHDAAGLMRGRLEITILALMTFILLAIGASLFSWDK